MLYQFDKEQNPASVQRQCCRRARKVVPGTQQLEWAAQAPAAADAQARAAVECQDCDGSHDLERYSERFKQIKNFRVVCVDTVIGILKKLFLNI